MAHGLLLHVDYNPFIRNDRERMCLSCVCACVYGIGNLLAPKHARTESREAKIFTYTQHTEHSRLVAYTIQKIFTPENNFSHIYKNSLHAAVISPIKYKWPASVSQYSIKWTYFHKNHPKLVIIVQHLTHFYTHIQDDENQYYFIAPKIEWLRTSECLLIKSSTCVQYTLLIDILHFWHIWT